MAEERQEGRASEDLGTEIKEIFTVFAHGHDLDKGVFAYEIPSVLHALGLDVTEEELKAYWAEIPITEESQTVHYEDFYPYAKQLLRTHYETAGQFAYTQRIIDAFRFFDKDKTGFLPAYQVRHVLTTLGNVLNPKEIKELLEQADPNQEGIVRYEEFVARIVGSTVVHLKAASKTSKTTRSSMLGK